MAKQADHRQQEAIDGRRRNKGKGKKKIEIARIENQSKRTVAFSKRREGLFKKAREICRLTGAEIAVLALSPGGNLYGCGDPFPGAVFDRYLQAVEGYASLCLESTASMEDCDSVEELLALYTKLAEIKAEVDEKLRS